ncbi:MAG: hypothetical protein RBS40_15685 [Rhodocyclaceae bacterium]|jgi:hypothetical protein|nr:hypothetical protein [Rhodocyclaceae bacterium]
MKKRINTLIAAALAGFAFLTALPASADGRGWDRHERFEHRQWRDGPPRGYAWGPHRHWRDDRYYVGRERVVIRERPVYRDYYYEAPVRYRYARDPAIVIGLDIPPLVIPLR